MQILEHTARRIASFKVPRYLAYVEAFLMTVGNDKVAKLRLVAGVMDLALDAFDRVDQVWR